MISNQKDLFNIIDKLLKVHGFAKKNDTWYLQTADCICFFHLGKASKGGNYENVMGCFLKELQQEQDLFPKYFKNDLKFSIENIIDPKLVREAFDLQNKNFSFNEREIVIESLINNYALPFLKDIETKPGIIQAVKKYRGLVNLMDVNLRRLLLITDIR